MTKIFLVMVMSDISDMTMTKIKVVFFFGFFGTNLIFNFQSEIGRLEVRIKSQNKYILVKK